MTPRCPKCQFPQYCPCASCQPQHQSKFPWVWVEGMIVTCNHCGFGPLEDYLE